MKKTFLFLVLFLISKPLFAQQPYVGEIRIFAGSFPPLGWMFCNGQTLPISEYEVLFTLIGTTYGGDGQESFALPDLQSRVPIGSGSQYVLGASGGAETVTLQTSNMPSHTHQAEIKVSSTNATLNVPTATTSLAKSGSLSGRAFVPNLSYNAGTQDVQIAAITTNNTGGSVPVSIIKPYCGIHYIISMYGIYPQQN